MPAGDGFTSAQRQQIDKAIRESDLGLNPQSDGEVLRIPIPGSIALAIAMFPVVALVGPLFDMWTTFGLFNTWPGLIIPYMSFTLPLAIWTLSAFFREIPWEMEQAAQVDGATSWQAFRKVIVPLAAPGVFTAAILTFFFAWNEFVLAISLTSSTASRR